jgi:DNA-binding XRE family transcriptional regulator
MAKKKMPTLAETVGSKIRELRTEKGMSQKQVGELAGLRRATVTDIENGKMNFELNTLISICHAVGLKIRIELDPE